MDIKEYNKIKTAKSTHSSIKRNHPVLHSNLRSEVIAAIVNSNPDFGSLQVKLTKHGV